MNTFDNFIFKLIWAAIFAFSVGVWVGFANLVLKFN